jgi:hypothetical protein
MTKFFALICGLMISSAAMAQDYGLTIGVHETTATANPGPAGGGAWLDGSTGTVSSGLGYDLGLTASFELVPSVRFRTGLLYDLRPFEYKANGGGGTVDVNFAYIDIPVNFQYNFTPMIGLYGGMIVGVKASDSANVPNGVNDSPNAKSLYPLGNVGVNFTFNDLLGFDLYYEAGFGTFADDFKNYSTFGLHFIYWL